MYVYDHIQLELRYKFKLLCTPDYHTHRGTIPCSGRDGYEKLSSAIVQGKMPISEALELVDLW